MNNLTTVQRCETATGFTMTEKQRSIIKQMGKNRQSYLEFHLNLCNTVSWYLVDSDGNWIDTISDKKVKPLEYAGILVRTQKGYILPEKFKN